MARKPPIWVVDFDSDAVTDFEDVKSRGDRKAAFNVVQKLRDLGPDLPSPHMKSLKGEADLFELRPMRDSAIASWFWRWLQRRRTSHKRPVRQASVERGTVDAAIIDLLS